MGCRRGGLWVRLFRVRAHSSKDPLERPNPAAQFVLRRHEDHEIGCALLQKLTAQLLEAHANRLGVPHSDATIR